MSETYTKSYFITGGGTGGHIYPALTIADALINENAKIYYVGNRHNMEYQLATEKGYKFLHVSITGMPRKLNIKFFYWIIRLLKSILFSIKYIKKYKPSVVFATGGYVSAPLIFASILTKTPYIMHDCDAMPGLVTRKLSKYAKFVTLAFDSAKKHIQNKNIIITGNPIREQFFQLTQYDAKSNLGLKNNLTLAVIGGSQGARTINNTIVEILKELIQEYDIQIIFQTGSKNFNELIDKLRFVYPGWENEKRLLLKPYFSDMISVLKASDIVISRAGSLSLSEICASDCAPIIVPYPYAAANHQKINAKYLLNKGACIYVDDKELEPNKLREILLNMLNNPIKINYLKQNSKYLAKDDAVNKIIGCINKAAKI